MLPLHSSLQIADQWRDFELLDCGEGMKKERWGNVALVRPDPQALWPRQRSDWGKWDGFYHRDPRGGGKWEFRRGTPEQWTIRYRELSFIIRPTSFKHTGLFPEQAANWDWFSKLIRGAGRPVSVLNLFGYTGGATVAAAAAGASVCHVDAAKGMVQWCRENAKASGLESAPVRYIVDDCMKFAEREARRGKRYDGILMDPPVFGRGKEGEMWRIEEHLWPLLERCVPLLSEQPLFFLINAYTAGISPLALANLLQKLMGRFGGRLEMGEVALPVTGSPLALPCGVFCRWEG
jgi:23S rRNA (cytosine1962-C5)-methyltransferase